MSRDPETNGARVARGEGQIAGTVGLSTPGGPAPEIAAIPAPHGVANGGTPTPVSPSAQAGTAVLDGARVGGHGGGGGPPRRVHRDLTTGSVRKHLWGLSWPQMLESVLNILDQLVDLLWAGRLPGGFRAVAGLGVAQSFTQFGMMARQGLDMSMRAMIARAVGAGDIKLANHVALQGFTMTTVYSVLMVIVGLALTDVLLRVIGASEAVKDETATYMRVQFVGMSTMSFRMMTAAALQASGDVVTPLKATTLTRVIHIALTPFLMFGWWWFPDMGLAGAALANVLAQLAGCALNFSALFGGNSRLHLSLRGYRADLPLIWRLLKLGAPASVGGLERATAQLALLRFVTPFGDVALAAYSITRRSEMFVNFGGMGMGQGAGILAGQNLGAGKPERAREALKWAQVYMFLLNGVVGALIFALPVLFVSLFTSNPEVVDLTSTWLRIQVFAAVFMVQAMVFQQAYNVAGDTMAPMVVTLLAVWGVEIPLAWFLAHSHFGVLGIAYASIAGFAARWLFYFPYFFWGRWMKVKVL